MVLERFLPKVALERAFFQPLEKYQSLAHPRQLLLRCSNTVHPWTYVLAPAPPMPAIKPPRGEYLPVLAYET